MTLAEFGESIKNKPFAIILLSALGAAILGGIVIFSFKNKANLSESIELFVQKMAPALNETTGFLMISYAVILCIGNVIMKTSPKYLASGGESQEEKTTGFVAWLQSKGLGWLPIFISVTIVMLMTFLPINNKILKIGIIAIVLCGVLMVALFFNAIIKLFGGKESFTNVKEEFGHIVTDDEGKNQPHNLKITVQVRGKAGDTGASPVTLGEFFVDIKNDSGDVHSQGWRSADPSHYNGIELGNNGWSTSIDLIYEPRQNASYSKVDKDADYVAGDDACDVYYSTVPASESNFISTLKILKQTKTIDVSEIGGQTYYFHLFPKGIKIFSGNPSKDKFQIGTEYTTNPETGICTLGGEEKLAKDDVIWLHPPAYGKENNLSLSNHIRLKITDTGTNNYGGFYSGSDHEKEKIKPTYDVKLFTEDGQDFDAGLDIGGNTIEKKGGPRFSIKNMQQFFGFDVDVVKESVTDSYIAYYCLVWGSFLGFVVYNWKQLQYNNESRMKIVPFLVAAVVETLLISQSHYSLDQSEVASSTGIASPTFSYAVAGFSTRIATVVAFLSSILTQVKD